ncbi:hypothetical protein KEM48_007850 [Puccinia striiformis f. sp. tritici PST-130]|nr:hypothetical protein KEM48_007850 [Puccinia striiformis f. sp. tritici PST-130]
MRFARRTEGIKPARAVEDVIYVLQYLNFLITLNDDSNARALFEKTISKINPESARPLWRRWAAYEFIYGDKAASEKLNLRVAEIFPDWGVVERLSDRHAYADLGEVIGRELGTCIEPIPLRNRSPSPVPQHLEGYGFKRAGGGGGGMHEHPGGIPSGPASYRNRQHHQHSNQRDRSFSPDVRGKRARGQRSSISPDRRNGPTSTTIGPNNPSNLSGDSGLRYFLSILPLSTSFEGPRLDTSTVLQVLSEVTMPVGNNGGVNNVSNIPHGPSNSSNTSTGRGGGGGVPSGPASRGGNGNGSDNYNNHVIMLLLVGVPIEVEVITRALPVEGLIILLVVVDGNEKKIKKLLTLYPLLLLKMRIGNPLPTSLPLEASCVSSCILMILTKLTTNVNLFFQLPKVRAARIFKSFVSPTNGIDGLIPSHVLRSAHGFAIFTIAKAGFLDVGSSGNGGSSCRLPDGRWSPPSAIGTGGMGFGGQVGAEVAEFILVLNSKSALTQFMSAGSITLGGNASVAIGPIGRNAEGSGALNSKGKLAAMYSYSKTKGAFAGLVSRAYGRGVTATKILAGHIDIPIWAEELSDILMARAGSYTEYVDRSSPLESPRNPSFEEDRPSFNNHPSFQSQHKTDLNVIRIEKWDHQLVNRTLLAPLTRMAHPVSSTKTDQSSLSRQDTENVNRPGPHLYNGPQSTLITGTGSSKKDDDDEIQSLSSIASDDDAPFDSINDGQDPLPPPRKHNLNGNEAKEQEDGIMNDLMSFDHIPPPSSTNYLSTAPTNGGGGLDEFRAQKNEQYIPEGIWNELSTNKKKTISGFTSTDKIHCFDSPEGPKAIPEPAPAPVLPRSNNPQQQQQQGEPEIDANDFLVGSSMPSVPSTQTDLTGYIGKVTALFDFVGDQDGDLSFRKGDHILIVDKIDDQWWMGSIGLRKGIFPLNRVSNFKH